MLFAEQSHIPPLANIQHRQWEDTRQTETNILIFDCKKRGEGENRPTKEEKHCHPHPIDPADLSNLLSEPFRHFAIKKREPYIVAINMSNLRGSVKPWDEPASKGAALCFGASGEEGRAVISGLLQAGYGPVFGATRDITTSRAVELANRGCHLLEVDLSQPGKVEDALTSTKAASIFLVTTTPMPPQSATFLEAEEKELHDIESFFDSLVKVYNQDKLSRHVIFSTLDNVKQIATDLSTDEGGEPFIAPLADGTICAHYTGKARGGQYGLKLVENIPELSLTLVTLPFLHSNFFGFAMPVPNEARTQWTIEAAFGDAEIDMFSTEDLGLLIPSILDDRSLYDGYNIKVTAETMALSTVASIFSDLFGKDVVYNPLTVEEMSKLPFPNAQPIAQMCQFLSDPRSAHDMEVTDAVLFPKKPQLFKDWLLTHSDKKVFEDVGLAVDAGPILSVVVFGSTGLQGMSVVKGLLADKRKKYTIRATSRDITQEKALAVKALDPERIELVECNFDDIDSCAAAADGVDGAFLVTDFFDDAGEDPDVELQHARNVIDACEASHSVRHLVFSTLEDIDEMNKRYNWGMPMIDEDGRGQRQSIAPLFHGKARAASYARTKRLSCTFVLLPLYSERFFELLAPEMKENDNGDGFDMIMHVPKADEGDEEPRLICMSIDDLGPAVANVFDSYQVFSGREIGMVTDFVTISEVATKITEVFFEETDADGTVRKGKLEKKDVTVDAWVKKKETTAKDLGQLFSYYSKTDAVKKRRSIAQTLKLVPDAEPLKQWIESNRNNASFHQRLGLR